MKFYLRGYYFYVPLKKLKAKHVVVQNNSPNLIIRDVYQYNAKTSLFTCQQCLLLTVHQLIKKTETTCVKNMVM